MIYDRSPSVAGSVSTTECPCGGVPRSAYPCCETDIVGLMGSDPRDHGETPQYFFLILILVVSV
ncbi:MAG: hypothetical protein ACOC44_19135 [Promethearchaeia archaeon]